MSLRELGPEEYCSIHRCLLWLEERGVLPPSTEPNAEEVDLRRAQRSSKDFRAGDLFYAQQWSNGGGYWIGYDTQEKRGYYAFAHH
jgi:hypothetical protein